MFNWETLTPIGLVLAILAMIFLVVIRGDFIPRKSHERELAVEKRRGDEWKENAGKWEAITHQQAQQISAMLEVGFTVQAVVRSAGPAGIEDTAPAGGA